MTKLKKHTILLVSFLFIINFISAQTYTSPLNIPVSLSANFGELRNNHFHSGLDYRTQYAVNKPVFAIEDGYVSRINISPSGYGLALYVTHPSTGHVSVYGHLNAFSGKIAQYATNKQYELESFRIDIKLEANELPVKRNEQIALSGNTGSSGGPHLHFEIRDEKTEEPIDPLLFYAHTVKDNIKPDLRGIAFYPIDNQGLVNGSYNPTRLNIGKSKNGLPLALPRKITAWGKIGVGVKAYDLMNGTSNIYGVKNIKLFVDDDQIFESNIERFSFDDTRMINSFIDFEDWRLNRSFFMKSFVEPNNRLKFYNAKNSGYIHIDREKIYKLRYELTDHHGNKTTYSFQIEGVRQQFPQKKACNKHFSHILSNSFTNDGLFLFLPTASLYTDCCFNYSKTNSSQYYSDIHQINDRPVALTQNAKLAIAVKNVKADDIQHLGVVQINSQGKESWIGGKYVDGYMEVSISELGHKYAVSIDKTAPEIVPINPNSWSNKKQIILQIKENQSGIASFRGEINGKFVLFTHDSKSPNYIYTFDDKRLEGSNLNLVFTATDAAGNEQVYKYNLK